MIDKIPDNFLIEGKLTLEQENILIEQINRFNQLNRTSFSLGNVLLNNGLETYFKEGTLIHGTSGYDKEMLDNIARTGILTGQAVGISEDGETYCCADFHRVDKDITVSKYNQEFTYNDGRCPFGKRRSDNSDAVAFVVGPDSKNLELLSYDCYREDTVASSITKSFIKCMPIKDKKKAASILYGVPASCINGIVIGGKNLNDIDKINYLIRLFPNSYIVTSYGELIYDPSRGEKLGDEIIGVRIEKASIELDKRKKLKIINTKNRMIIDLINKNILLMDLISKNCDIRMFDNLDVVSLLKMINEVLFGEQIKYGNSDFSLLWGVIKSYLSLELEGKISVCDSFDKESLEKSIVALKKENICNADKIEMHERLIIDLEERYSRLWNQMFRDCSYEEIKNILVSMGWQGNIDAEYLANMRQEVESGYGK